MNKFAQIVREIVDAYLDEDKKYTGAPSFGYTIADKSKADKVKSMFSGHYIADLIDAVEAAGESGIARKELATTLSEKTGKKISPELLNVDLNSLSVNGVISKGRPEKAEKAPSTGQRGRKSSDKSKAGIVRMLFQNFKDNPEFEPSEDDITYDLPKGLGTEKLDPKDVEKVKNSALGTAKRGRPKMKTDDLGDVKAAMKESLSEQFRRMHKLAGLA